MSEKSLRLLIEIYQRSKLPLNKITNRIPLLLGLHTTKGLIFPSQRIKHSHNYSTLISKNGVRNIPSLVDESSEYSRNGRSIEVKFEKALEDIESDCTQLLSQDTIPSEKDVENLITSCKNVAEDIIGDTTISTKSNNGAASALLALDAQQPGQDTNQTSSEIARKLQSLSSLVHSIIKHPKIFISPTILKMYVNLHASLARAETLPEAFHLYSHKPVPLKDLSPIRFSIPKSSIPANSIPPDVAEKALNIAIKSKQLVVAIDIIEVAYTGRAFQTSKLIRKALFPASIATIIPFATYTFASQLSYWQTSMDTNLATNVVFLGMMAYIGLTSTVGLVAIFTSNDQMDRITWAPGVPLFQRWMREDERAAIDLVAGAWGFRESWRRGDEEGQEWDLIKEWVSRRAMILDRVELMEGMN